MPIDVLHVLDRLPVPLVVERREVVGRAVPLVVDLPVAAGAVVAFHEEVGGDHATDVGLGGGREERSVRTLALAIHRRRGQGGVHDRIGRRKEVDAEPRARRRDGEERRNAGPAPSATGDERPRVTQPGRERQESSQADEPDVRVQQGPERTCRAGDEQHRAHGRAEAKGECRRSPEGFEGRPVAPGQTAERRGRGQADEHVQHDVAEVDHAGIGPRREVDAVEPEGHQHAHQDPRPTLHRPSAGQEPEQTSIHPKKTHRWRCRSTCERRAGAPAKRESGLHSYALRWASAPFGLSWP